MKYGSEACKKRDKFSTKHLKREFLTWINVQTSILERGGAEAFRTHRHLIPTKEDRFEHECMECNGNGDLRVEHTFRVCGKKVFDEGWSPAIKEKYLRHAPTDVEQFEGIKTIEMIEHDLMMFGESIFEGWGNEVREKWGQACPTEEARFKYNYTEIVDEIMKADEKLKLEEKLAFEGYRPEIRDKYFHLLSRGSRL